MSKNAIQEFHIPRWEELPEIDLYLDQVVTFIDKYLVNYIENDINNKEEDKDEKIITKTMINNYVKQKIIEAPVKKKYNRNNIAYLFVICILKQVYSISDIDKLIKLAIKDRSIDVAYNKFCDALEKAVTCTLIDRKFLYDKAISEDGYILFNVVQTFACKLYVEKNFLDK